MHSRIFQIESRFCPEDEFITANGFSELSWFLDNIADYVANTAPESRQNDIEWLQNALGEECIEWNRAAESFILREGFKERFFAPYYEIFLEELDRLTKNISLKNFSASSKANPFDLGYCIYKLNSAFNDKFSFYISSNEEPLITLHEFIRYAKYDMPYYIGGILDYHS